MFAVVLRVLKTKAITNMDYVRRKKDADPISDEHRMAALSLACSEVPGGWLKPDRRGADFPSAGRLIQKLQAELPGVSVFNIVGADTVVRLCKNGSKFMQPMVVVGRAGCNNRLVKAMGSWHACQGLLFLGVVRRGVV